MYNGSVKDMISKQINAMMPELEKMVDHATSSEMAAQNVMNYVSSKIAAMSRGWLSTEYSELSEKTLAEAVFQTPINANKFYALELEKKIAAEMGIECIDNYNVFLHESDEDCFRYTIDGLHANEYGRELIANAIYEYLNR